MKKVEENKPSNKWHSIYAKHIDQYVQIKHQLGFKFQSGIFFLSKIDELALQRKETAQGITKDFAFAWSTKKANESGYYHYDRIRHLAKFSAYLKDMGIPSYIPKLSPYPKSTFIPYIYSSQEIKEIFKALDELQFTYVNKNSAVMCIPAIIRLLYATGLRISETLALKEEDVNLQDHYLKVRDSKNGKERIIPIAASLVEVCKSYKQHRDQLPLLSLRKKQNNQTDFFFVRINGQQCSRQSIVGWFKKSLEKTSISHRGGLGNHQAPRLHDLRHTFAVNALASMAQAGLDLYVSLPILSNYLGHQSIESTEHYVRLTASQYPDLIRDVDQICMNVFPKSAKKNI